jgi:acetyl/propionyl-CoA carboxylase alpha subunit
MCPLLEGCVILEIGCDGYRATVEVTAAPGVRRVAVDGRDVSFDWARLPDGQYSLILGGRVYDFIIEFSDGNCSVIGRDGSHTLRVADTRRPATVREVEEGQSGLQRLKADMPGKVVRVLVKEGEPVAYDQSLLVLEAMKMQNEIRAPKSGVVREIGVTPGTAVNTGEFLLSLE